MSNGSHPIWPIIRLIVLFFGLMGLLWVNARQFDATEMKTLVQYVIFGGLVEGGVAYLNNRKRGESCDEEDEPEFD